MDWLGKKKDNYLGIVGWAIKTGFAQQNMKDANLQLSTFKHSCKHPHSKQIF